MGYLLLVFLIIVAFVFYGLYIGKFEPHKPKILLPLLLVALIIIVAAILTQRSWWAEFLQYLNTLI
ncbi:MAG: hypothetical protein QXR19_01855 [Candidatus Jordarchaeaceae archaeon]